jgi:hypothetical protein
MRRGVFLSVLFSGVVAAAACASLQGLAQIIQPPTFEQAADRRTELRLLGPSGGHPGGGASVRIWTTVTNPNPFGFTLSTLHGTLFIDEVRAADGDFPLGLPLTAREQTTIPLDLSIGFAELPRLATAISRSAGRTLPFRFEGTIGVDAGRFGTPTYGPMTIFSGELNVLR